MLRIAAALVVAGLCVGCGAGVKFPRSKPEAIQLPVVAPEKPETKTPGVMIEIPLEAGKDIEGLKKSLVERYEAVAAEIVKANQTTVAEAPVGLRVDARLEYRAIYEALVAGIRKGFTRFHLACRKSSDAKDVQYFVIAFNFWVGDWNPPETARLTVMQGEKGLVYQLDGNSRSLDEICADVKARALRNPQMILVVNTIANVSVQTWAAIYADAVKTGVRDVRLGKMIESEGE